MRTIFLVTAATLGVLTLKRLGECEECASLRRRLVIQSREIDAWKHQARHYYFLAHPGDRKYLKDGQERA